VTVSWNGILSVRDSATGERVFEQEYKATVLSDLSAPADRRFFVYSLGYPPPTRADPPPPQAVLLRSWPIRQENSRELPYRWSFISAMQVSPTGRFLGVIHGAPPSKLEIYDFEHSKIVAAREVGFGGTGSALSWSTDEDLIAINGDHRCFILEMPTLAIKHELFIKYPCFVSFSPFSRFLALGAWSKSYIIPREEVQSFKEL
jgi:hypothetical protein